MQYTNLEYPQPVRTSFNRSVSEPVFFVFEDDFVEENVRCIPMIVRYKLDLCGIKLKLNEWSKMTLAERRLLAAMPCVDDNDLFQYRHYLQEIVLQRTGTPATDLAVDTNPEWLNTNELPSVLREKLKELSWVLPVRRWHGLNNLQRFVLLKLCRPGHENRNFPIAMKEFGLI